MRHDQAISNAMRLREQLSRAEAKEQELALELATAEIGRRLAAKALAVETGAVFDSQPGPDGKVAGGSSNQWT
eukprot:7438324-Pyramimonas_sp.AAC.1